MDFNALHGLHQPQDASLVDTADPTSLQDGSLIDIEVVTLQSSGPELPVHPEFAFTDGTIELQTLDCIFWVHEFQLTKFAVFANRIQEAREQATESGANPRTRISIPVFMKSDDFVGTLRLLYASFVPSPEAPSFDCVVFISALRIATLYEYPDLREFAIRELEEEFLLPAIRRFELANELSLFDWESAILNEFCNRSEPISEDEAISLGETRMMHILDYREKQPSLQTSESQAPKIVTNQSINQCKTSIKSWRQHCAHSFAPECASWVVFYLIMHILFACIVFYWSLLDVFERHIPGVGAYPKVPTAQSPVPCYIVESPQEFDEEKKELGPDAQVWKTYVREADRVDEELVDGWNKSMDVNLIFAALFSAISTAFVIESYKNLKQDPADVSAQTLLIISETLLSLGNRSQAINAPLALELEEPAFKASLTAICVNALWFLSLSLSVAVSVVSMLAKEWCLEFMSGRTGPPGPQARRRQRRWDGIVEWRMKEVVVMLPSLIHLSLLLFAVGLCIFLWDVHFGVAIPVIIVTTLAASTYFACTILPFMDNYCPYGTVLSRLYKQLSYIHSQSSRDAMIQDETTSRALNWMIVNCETPRSVDVALQSLAAADPQLPPETLEKCDAWTLIRQRLETSDANEEQANPPFLLCKRALHSHVDMRLKMDGQFSYKSGNPQLFLLMLGVQSCINSVVYKLLRQLSSFDRNRAILEECKLICPRVLRFECGVRSGKITLEQPGNRYRPWAHRSIGYDRNTHPARSDALAEEVMELLVRHANGQIDLEPPMQGVLSASLVLLMCRKAVDDPVKFAQYALRLIRAYHSPSSSNTNNVAIKIQIQRDTEKLNQTMIALLLGVLSVSQCNCSAEGSSYFSAGQASGNSRSDVVSRQSEKVVEMAWNYLNDFTYPGGLKYSFNSSQWALHGGLHMITKAEYYGLNSEDCTAITNIINANNSSHHSKYMVDTQCTPHHAKEFGAALATCPNLDALTPQLSTCLVFLSSMRGTEYINPTPGLYVLILKKLCQSGKYFWYLGDHGDLLARFPFAKASPRLIHLLSACEVVSWLVESLDNRQEDLQAFSIAQLWLLLNMCFQTSGCAGATPNELEMILNRNLALENDWRKQEDAIIDLETRLLVLLGQGDNVQHLDWRLRQFVLRVLECMLQQRNTPLPNWAHNYLKNISVRLRGLDSFVDLDAEASNLPPTQFAPGRNTDPTNKNPTATLPDVAPGLPETSAVNA